MSSILRGQANLHDSFESNSSNTSNKRKRVIHQNPTFNNIHLNMNPPQAAAQELSDHHLQKQEREEEEEAAALLNHMHLMHRDDHPRISEDYMHVDYHGRPNAAGDHRVADLEMLQRHAHLQNARENSSSSDASATNYFSGDSDLTAEPIISCAADEDGAKSSNSGSSNPFKLPCTSPSTNQGQALAAGLGQEYPINLPPQHIENERNDKEEVAQMLPMAVVPSTSTASMSMWNSKTFPAPKPLASSQMVQMHGNSKMIGGSHSSKAAGSDSGKGSESWLELRLGFSTELQHKRTQNLEASITAQDGRTKNAQSWDDVTESMPVTLQLLPENSKVTEKSAGATGVMRPGIVAGSALYSNFPPVYHPTAAAFSHARPKFDENHHTSARLVPSDHQQILLNQTNDPAVAALQPLDHQRFLNNQNKDPAADRHQSNQGISALPGYEAGIVYDQVHRYADGNDQRRWLAAETSDMMRMAAPSMIAAVRPTEIYRPTASLGWPTGKAETRSWSANSYTPPVQLQRTMSWQGLLRSMTTDPLLHPSQDLPMCSFDTDPEVSAPRGRRHMFPVASTNRLPSGHTMPVSHQRLRLATSRRTPGLWFSLQEAHHFSNENISDQQEQQSAIQKVYLRIRDGKMQISVLKSYLIRKLESSGSPHYNSDEVEITCRGKTLAPTLTIQHVRDTIWLNKDFSLNEAIGFRYTNRYLNDSHNRVMALCYQRHNTETTHTITLNLLKT